MDKRKPNVKLKLSSRSKGSAEKDRQAPKLRKRRKNRLAYKVRPIE